MKRMEPNKRSAGDAGLRPSVFLAQLPGAPDHERLAAWAHIWKHLVSSN
jgi:hypothetical protein